MFELKVLGPPSIVDSAGADPREMRQKRRLGLLALLAVPGERGISRDHLQAYLWPEGSAAQSRHALDQLVYATRRALGDDPFIIEGGILRLNPTVIESDIEHFRLAVSEGRLEDATASYGGPLLDGFYMADSRELEDWIDRERTKVAEQYARTVENLARRGSEGGDHASASRWWLTLAASDPDSARIALEVVQSLAASGDAAAALRYARSYQERIRTNLDVEPDPRIEKLACSIAASNVPQKKQSAKPIASSAAVNTEVERPLGAPRGLPRTGIAVVALGILFVAVFAFLRADREDEIPARNAHPFEARQDYLRATNAWSDRSKEGLDSAVVFFRRAIDIDPAYAEAYAGLANAYVLLAYSGYRPAEAMYPKAKAAALRAIQFDSTLSAPYAALGMELTGERKFDEAESAFHTALARDEHYATAHQWYGILLMIRGRMRDAVQETGRAAQLDPLSLQIQNNYATFLSASGQSDAALRHYQKVVGEEPDSAWVRRNPWLLTNMAAVYSANRQFEKALRYARQAVEISPHHPRALVALANVQLAMGQPERAREVFAQADTTNEQYASYRAFMYLNERKADSAFVWFDKVKEWGIPILITLRTSMEMQRLENDPRRRALF